MGAAPPGGATVETVLGPVPADALGVVAVHESLLSVLPGAQYAFDITIDQAEVFGVLADRLAAFRAAGGGAIVDSTGMFHGRDLPLYEALAQATGVHIIATTGMGPEEMLGGYFLTPQTNPPTPWPADKFAELFSAEVADGMVVPRLERRGNAGMVVTATSPEGMTATDESLLRGAARTALATGVPLSVRAGTEPLQALDIVLDEQVPASRVVIGDGDRAVLVAAEAPLDIVRRGAYVAIDNIGLDGDPEHLTDSERAALVASLVRSGHGDRILLSCNAIGVAKGLSPRDVPFSHVLTVFVPMLRDQGLSEEAIQRILIDNPRDLLTRR